ncbi:MAG TPA: peptide-methionine (S)-S-oxide reductase MsrA [Acidimicrobiales bacterium]|nr:peptide-methionine (S)-S-oxide reductase MsrA [Acidimicrobiales bacterium]
MALFSSHKQEMVLPSRALPGRSAPIIEPGVHVVLHTPIAGPFPEEMERAIFGLGCFWGAERIFWKATGVYTTAVGYAGGFTPNPTYEEVCSGKTGHAEVVLVVFDPARASYAMMLQRFFEGHDPTQYMRQGNDVGTQYRSAIYTFSIAQHDEAVRTRERYAKVLAGVGLGEPSTEIAAAGPFYYAEEYHQQYLAKNPDGYCGLGGTGVGCPVGVLGDDQA